ncbi:transposable element Tcb1 transposase [Trichonephila clavipes]|nr:transposable element Tcb1 transposase [Trichonephila clavipes]
MRLQRKVVFDDESSFNLSSDDNRVCVWRLHGERLNPAFALQLHTVPTAGVMVWGAITYNTGSHLLLIHCTMTSQRAYLGSFGMASWASHEFERTRSKVTANMERNVSKPHTELVCLNVPDRIAACIRTREGTTGY